MKYKEFVVWCNERAADGCWGMNTALICINIMREVEKELFWRREKIWRDKYKSMVLRDIVTPITKIINNVREVNEDGK